MAYLFSEDDDDDDAGETNLLALELSCPICKGFYQNPVRLPCEHSFCRECIEQLFSRRTADVQYSCPVCRRCFQNTPSMPKHLALARMVEVYQNSRERRQRKPEEIQNDPLWLRTDTEADGAQRAESHGTIVLADRRCPFHPNREVTHLCFEEWQLLCIKCLQDGTHVGHRARFIEEAAQEWKTQVPDVIERLEMEKALTAMRVVKCADLEEKAKKDVAEAQEAVASNIQELMDHLCSEKERMVQEIGEVGDKYLERLQEILVSITDRLEEKDRHIQSIQEVSESQDHFAFVKTTMSFMSRTGSVAGLSLEMEEEEREEEDLQLHFDNIEISPVLQTLRGMSSESSDSD